MKITLFLILFAVRLYAQPYTVTLAWDESDPTVVSYNLYTRTQSGVYGSPTKLGDTLTTSVIIVSAGDYYFVVTALNEEGGESLRSNEVEYVAAAASPAPTPKHKHTPTPKRTRTFLPTPLAATSPCSSDPAFYNNRGFDFYQKRDYDKAISNYNDAMRLDPNNAPAYNNRGIVYRKQGKDDKAEADFAKAKQLGYGQ